MTNNRDANQTVINQLSLVMTISEDVAKACKSAGVNPQITELLLRFHSQHMEMEKAINSLRTQQLEMAKLTDKVIDSSLATMEMINNLDKHVGFSPEEIVTAEKRED